MGSKKKQFNTLALSALVLITLVGAYYLGTKHQTPPSPLSTATPSSPTKQEYIESLQTALTIITRDGSEYVTEYFGVKDVKVIRVGEGEYCASRVNKGNNSITLCESGLTCKSQEGVMIADAPGICAQ